MRLEKAGICLITAGEVLAAGGTAALDEGRD
jgi:hypothetical protein